MQIFTPIVECCPESNLLVGYIPGLPGAQPQGTTMDHLHQELMEVLDMLVKNGELEPESEFVGMPTSSDSWATGNIPFAKAREFSRNLLSPALGTEPCAGAFRPAMGREPRFFFSGARRFAPSFAANSEGPRHDISSASRARLNSDAWPNAAKRL